MTVWPPDEAAPCPQCGMPSADKHSIYTRRALDLPWGDAAIAVDIVMPKLRCHHAVYPQNISCRRLDPWMPAMAGDRRS
ncbi:MAG: transposase family protein [Firmicutes bacterium]|nr:transposase family protein [Bacillota bacterium]